jgi:predicted transcriptional regulator
MEKVEAFLTLYQKLDEYLRRNAGQARDLSFAQRLDALAQKHPMLRRNAAKLKDYGDLRNALVHHRDPGGGWIAEPSERTLQEFEQIVQAILLPQKLIPRFQKLDIRLFSPQDPLVTALQHMREHDYSQVVVRIEGKLSLLTVEGIARWLEEQAQEDIISVREAIIRDARRYEQAENVSIMSRDQTVNDAMEIFMLAIEQRKPRIYALLITERGKATERLQGIVTPWDLLSVTNP